MKKFKEFNENNSTQPIKYVYILIDQQMHSYEAILGIYDSFDKAMSSKEWSKRGETPDRNGYGTDLFIYKEILNKDL